MNKNTLFADTFRASIQKEKAQDIKKIFDAVNDEDMAVVIWSLWREDSFRILDEPIPALNSRTIFFRKKNTIRTLIKTKNGKEKVWQMLHDASAWLP